MFPFQELNEDTLQRLLPGTSRDITGGLDIWLTNASLEWTSEAGWDDAKAWHPWPFKNQGTEMNMEDFRAHLQRKKPTSKVKETIEPQRRQEVVRNFVFLFGCVTYGPQAKMFHGGDLDSIYENIFGSRCFRMAIWVGRLGNRRSRMATRIGFPLATHVSGSPEYLNTNLAYLPS